jgi:hypothetical protein
MRPILRARPFTLALAALAALASCDAAPPLASGEGPGLPPEGPRYASAPFPAPANFTAQGPDSSSWSVRLSWEDVAGDEMYLVQWRKGVGEAWTTLVTTSVNRTSYSTDSLTLAETNDYRVAVMTADFRVGDFATLRLKPVAHTQPAIVADSVATLRGEVRTNGGFAAYWFEWGTDPALAGAAKTPEQQAFSSTAPLVSVAQQVRVVPGTAYYVRAAARNAGGTSYGEILRFDGGVPDAPAGVTAVFSAAPVPLAAGGSSAGHNVSVRWTHDGAEAATFRVQRRLVGAASWVQAGVLSPGEPGYRDRVLVDQSFPVTTDREYDYRALACDAAGQCAPSGEVRVAIQGLPAPAGLSAARTSDGRVVLGWGDLASEESYPVQWRAGETGSWQTLVSTGKNVTSYTTDRVTAGVVNYYRVAGEVRSFRAGAFAETTLAAGEGRSLQVQTGSFTANSSTSVTVRGGVTPGGLAAMAWFEWGTDPALAGAAQTTPRSAGAGVSPVLSSDTLTISTAGTYYYRAVASNSQGTVRGAILSFHAGPPSAPGLTAAFDSASYRIVTSWTYAAAVSPASFRVDRRTTGETAWTQVASLGGSARQYVDGSFAVNGARAFDYRVRACNAAGECVASNVASARTVPLPAPTGLTAAPADSGKVAITWQPVPNAVRYVVQWRTIANGEWTLLSAESASRTSYTGRGIEPGRTNYYRVTAEASSFRTGISAEIAIQVP